MIEKLKKFILNQNSKAILNYCFRVFVFLLLCREIIYDYISRILLPILSNLLNNKYFDDPFVAVGVFAIINVLFHDYLFAKICGLFKNLDRLNIFISLIIIILIDIIRGYSFGLTIQLNPFKILYDKPNFIFTLIFLFFLYKFLNFLTKIFPTPFKQIGYIFSIELLKDIYKDVKKDIQENYLKQK